MWDTTDVPYEDKQIVQFADALRKREITWYMNFTENQTRMKDDIKANFLAFFKTKDVTHLAVQKVKDIKQVWGECV